MYKGKEIMIGKDICDEILKVINARGKNYGDIKGNHEDIAKGWEVILNTPISAEKVALCMDWVKTVRLKSNPKHRDSYVDKIGYAITYSECVKDK